MRKREKVLGVLAALLLLASVLCLTVLPGVRFSGYLLAALAGLCVFAGLLWRWAEKNRTGRAVWRGFLALLTMALFLFLTVEGLIFFRGGQDHSALPVDAVIVLGAGVNGETPSLTLRTRIEAAADYLTRHPGVPVVLSGGKGPGEAITEAEAMRRGLAAAGVEEDRLLLEERSTSTAENFAFSKELLEERGLDTGEATIAVVTSDFHLFRAHLIAERAGLATIGVPAELPWRWLAANYYVREFFALGKTLMFD